MSIEPYSIAIDEGVLTDLRERLGRVRWPDEVENDNWARGARLDYLQELVSYWIEEFDWRTLERKLNELPQFRTTIDGLGIHFAHVRGRGPSPLPLVVTHGWPSTFFELSKLLPLLTDPAHPRRRSRRRVRRRRSLAARLRILRPTSICRRSPSRARAVGRADG